VFQYNLGIVPRRKPITVVIGKPVPVPRIENPTPEDILDMHKKYVAALQVGRKLSTYFKYVLKVFLICFKNMVTNC
jgi:hypothetical protein